VGKAKEAKAGKEILSMDLSPSPVPPAAAAHPFIDSKNGW
jgi:hypothetical protein